MAKPNKDGFFIRNASNAGTLLVVVDRALGIASGIEGFTTPKIEGQQVTCPVIGCYSFDELEQELREALKGLDVPEAFKEED